jgi:hypothetical protein
MRFGGEATPIALWVAHAHAIEAADCTPCLQNYLSDEGVPAR